MPAVDAPPSSLESVRSIKEGVNAIRAECRARPALDTSELEDLLHYVDAIIWRALDILIENASYVDSREA